jgi:hypothetical protein
MHWTRLPGEIRRRPIWQRIDHAAELMNPLLVMAAALLALVNLSVYSALEIARHCPPPTHAAVQPASVDQRVVLPPAQN